MSDKKDPNTMAPAEAGEFVGYELLGTADFPQRVFARHDMDEGLENNTEFCAALDNIAMCCSCCDWYVEPGELNDNDECSDCAGEYDDG